MLINTAVGAASVRPEWVNVSRVFGVGTLEHVTRIVFPASVPMIMTGMRMSIGIAWFVIVAAEMVGAQSGIGYFIWNEWNNLQIASMIVAIVLIGLIGLALDTDPGLGRPPPELSGIGHGLSQVRDVSMIVSRQKRSAVRRAGRHLACRYARANLSA